MCRWTEPIRYRNGDSYGLVEVASPARPSPPSRRTDLRVDPYECDSQGDEPQLGFEKLGQKVRWVRNPLLDSRAPVFDFLWEDG